MAVKFLLTAILFFVILYTYIGSFGLMTSPIGYQLSDRRSEMAVTYRKATHEDIESLVRLRLDYMAEDRGELDSDTTEAIVRQLRDYFARQLNNNFIAFLAEDNGQAVSTVFMAVAEKPANPSFISGKTATILNVFTYPGYRRKGIATRLLTMMIDEAKAMYISYLELSATDAGKPVYEKLGFVRKQSRYTEMKLVLL